MSAQAIPDAFEMLLMGTAGQAAEQIQADERKQYATLQARAALRGIVLVKSHTERGEVEYIASLHAMTKAFSSLQELSAWLDRVEGRRA